MFLAAKKYLPSKAAIREAAASAKTRAEQAAVLGKEHARRGLLQGGAKRIYEAVGQMADKSHGISENDGALFWNIQPAHSGIQSCKQLVCSEHFGLGERVKQR